MRSTSSEEQTIFSSRRAMAVAAQTWEFKDVLKKAADVKLVPFYSFSLIFLYTYEIHRELPPETVTAAVLKALPIWSLALFVFLKNLKPGLDQDSYPAAFFYGLLIASVGDLCLIWRHTLFSTGVFFFGVGHLFYLLGLKERYRGDPGRSRLLYFLFMMCKFLTISGWIDSYTQRVLYFPYLLCLLGVGIMTAERYENVRSLPAFLGAAGAGLFVISDTLIAIDKYITWFPLAEFLVMVTYYGGQLGLALSTCDI